MSYTVSTLAKLFSLDYDTLMSIIESEGVIVYDSRTLSKIGYIPTLASYFKISGETPDLKKNASESWFETSVVNEIMTVSVKKPEIPVSAYLFSDMYDQLEFGDKASILLPALPGKKLFIADTGLIRRLSQGVSNDYIMLPFVEGEKNNEQ